MRYLRGCLAVALIIGVAGIWWLRHRTWFDTDVRMPKSVLGSWTDTSGWPRVELTHEGFVRFEGATLTLAALTKRLRGDSTSSWASPRADPILLCIDARSPAAHVCWLPQLPPSSHRVSAAGCTASTRPHSGNDVRHASSSTAPVRWWVRHWATPIRGVSRSRSTMSPLR